MSSIHKILFCFVLVVFLSITDAFAQQPVVIADSSFWQVKVQDENMSEIDEGFQFLAWSRRVYPLQSTGQKNYALLKGNFKTPVKQATLNGKLFPVEADGSFTLRIIVPSENKLIFNIFATDLNDHEYKMQYSLMAVYPNKATEFGLSPWKYDAGAGLAFLGFRELGFDIRAGVAYQLVPTQWDLSASAFYNLSFKVRYIGIDIKGTYHVIKAPLPLQFSLSADLSVGDLVSEMGISPELIYFFKNGNSLFWYGKFAYAFSGAHTSFFKDDREVVMGVHYSFPVTLKNRLTVGIDLEQLNLSQSDQWTNANIAKFFGKVSF